MGYIYTITNKINNKIYVGQTINPEKRWKKHLTDDVKNPNLLLGKAFLKYGRENFTFKVIEECENSKMSEREIYWIETLHTYFKDHMSNGYNMTRGGEAMFGDSNPFYSRNHNKDTRKVLSEYAKTRTGSKNPFYNKHHSEEFKNKRRGMMFFGPNVVKCIAKNDKNTLYFNSIREAYENFKDRISYEWFRKSVRKSIKYKNMFLDYYWYKSVETIPDECKGVELETSANSKCVASQ